MDCNNQKLERKVLDYGLVRLIDTMPLSNSSKTSFEEAIVQMARVSYGSGTKSFREDMGLVKYLLENDHTSPFEGVVLKFHLKMPIFVARQWVRHRTASINEYSARYSVIEDTFYIPEINRLNEQSSTNKQSSSESVIKDALNAQSLIIEHSNNSYALYKNLLEKGLSREQSRMVLPVNVYTEMYWVMNLHNLLKFLRLRMDHHAQYEIQVFANAIFEILTDVAPNIMSVWKSSSFEAIKFTQEEIEAISPFMEFNSNSEITKEGWSKRRKESLMEKIRKLFNGRI
jgi:thymidylate synthase (FAD)